MKVCLDNKQEIAATAEEIQHKYLQQRLLFSKFCSSTSLSNMAAVSLFFFQLPSPFFSYNKSFHPKCSYFGLIGSQRKHSNLMEPRKKIKRRRRRKRKRYKIENTILIILEQVHAYNITYLGYCDWCKFNVTRGYTPQYCGCTTGMVGHLTKCFQASPTCETQPNTQHMFCKERGVICTCFGGWGWLSRFSSPEKKDA